jgi:lipopolysaccharide heptosyltransferase II
MIPLPSNPRILITRTDRIGDLVVSTPIFEVLRKKFPKAHLAVCVFREHRDLVQGNPFLDEIILYEKSGSEKNWFGQLRFARMIRKRKFDLVLHLHATNRMHIMGWLAGIPIRIGYDRRAAWALTDVHRYDKKEGLKHESAYLSDFLMASGLSDQSANPFFPFVPVLAQARLSVQNLLLHFGILEDQPYGVIHPSASDVTKMWPAEKFAELVRTWKVARHWVVIGDSTVSDKAQKISELSGLPLVNLCGQLSLGMLTALFENAEIVISNDSGPAHIAAAVGAPTISIFGRWQPGLNAERWKPLGRNVAIVTPKIEGIPEVKRKVSHIEEILAEDVRLAARSFLKGDAT